MEINFVNEKNTIALVDVNVGECFMRPTHIMENTIENVIDKGVYIRTNCGEFERTSGVPKQIFECVCLDDGIVVNIRSDERVEVVNAVLNVSKK